MANEFSVHQWFPDGQYERNVVQFVSAEDAVKRAVALTRSVGGRLGFITRVIITDGGDCIVWEWLKDQGVVFPPKEVQ